MVPYAKRMEKMAFTANVVKGLFGSMTNPDIISFSGGSPAREALPVDTIRQLADEVLRTDTRGVEALQYGPIEGIRDLREVVVRELLAPKGIDCGGGGPHLRPVRGDLRYVRGQVRGCGHG